MNVLSNLFTSSLGKKYLMAISGVALTLFAVGHMAGNLQIFLPPEAINRYARLLHASDELLWGVRLILLAMVGVHIWSAVQLTVENKEARPVQYAVVKPNEASFASRTMIWSGLIVAAFIVFHLLHYTVKLNSVTGVPDTTPPLVFADLKTEDGLHQDVFAMVVAGFSVWYISLFYVVAVGLLCTHLSHGIQAMFQSLGLRTHSYSPLIKKASVGIAIALFVGYAVVPAAVLAGYGKEYLKERVAVAAKAASGKEGTK
jgi:succinate dehydrogenase / fumarate reductase cytochrome b subunit